MQLKFALVQVSVESNRRVFLVKPREVLVLCIAGEVCQIGESSELLDVMARVV